MLIRPLESLDTAYGDIKKKMFNSGNGESSRTRYAAVAEANVDGDKVKLTKFINKATFDDLKVDVVS